MENVQGKTVKTLNKTRTNNTTIDLTKVSVGVYINYEETPHNF
jgi:predicted solute-binding protein